MEEGGQSTASQALLSPTRLKIMCLRGVIQHSGFQVAFYLFSALCIWGGIFSFYTLFRTCCSDFRSYITVSDARMNDNYLSGFLLPEILPALLFTEILVHK